MSIQNYDIQIPAGGTQMIEAAAQILDFLSSGSAFDQIKVQPDVMQGAVTLKLGQGFDAGAIVQRWLVQNPGTTAINGTVVLSTAGFRNYRISGDVNVLDGGKSRTLANMAFGGVVTSPAVSAQNSRVQLWNPAGSGIRCVVESIQVVNGQAGYEGGYLAFNAAQLTTVAPAGIAKLSGGNAPVAKLCIDATASGATGSESSIIAPAQAAYQIKFAEPLVVTPGYGLLVWGATLNQNMQANFEWYEEPNT